MLSSHTHTVGYQRSLLHIYVSVPFSVCVNVFDLVYNSGTLFDVPIFLFVAVFQIWSEREKGKKEWNGFKKKLFYVIFFCFCS